MKLKKFEIVSGLSAMGLLVLCCYPVLQTYQNNTKSAIFDFVQTNEAELEQFAQALWAEGERSAQYESWTVEVYRSANTIQFCVGGKGLGSATSYTGFYYSLDGALKGFQGVALDYEPDGAGWSWQETDGDNHAYTEQITGNWYWYEMSF